MANSFERKTGLLRLIQHISANNRVGICAHRLPFRICNVPAF